MALFRERERFERSDVPRERVHKNIFGLVVIVAVFALTAFVFDQVKTRVELETRLDDSDLADALDEQSSELASYDGVTCTLVLQASSLDSEDGEGATLVSARVLALNASTGVATQVNIPLEALVTSGETQLSVSDCYAANGAEGTVAPVANACGLEVSSVVVCTGDVLDQTAALAAAETDDLVSSAADLLGMMRTNLDSAGLLQLASELSSVGVSAIASADAPLAAQTTTDEAGNAVETGSYVVDAGQVQGIVAALATPAEEAPAEEAAAE